MNIKVVMIGTALTGLLMVLSQISFGVSGDIPPVPVTREPVELASTAGPIMEKPVLLAQASNEVEVEEKGSDEIELSTGPDLTGVEIETDDSGEDLITISLDNAPLADVVRMFSRISGANIVAGTNLQGSVTVSMHDVPWEPALSAILDSVSLVLVEKTSGIFSIISKSDLAGEPVSMDTLFLNYTSVSNVIPVVRRMLVSTNSSVSAFPSANAMVVQETASRLNAIRSTVKKIDRPRPQVYIEAKFIELNDSAIESLGVNWQVLENYNVRAGNLVAEYTDEHIRTDRFEDNLIDNDGTVRTINQVNTEKSGESLFEADGELDFGTVQSASIQGRNAIPSFTVGTGLDPDTVSFGSILPVSEKESNNEETRIRRINNTFNRAQDVVNADTATRLLSAVLSADELAVTLSALKQEDGVEVVSNPKIIVANGETASIHIGVNEPNITAVPQGDTGDRFAISLDQTNPFIEIGVKLEVTPTVNTEDNITVRIAPELSRILGEKAVSGAGVVGVSYPITSVRKIETEFQLASGKTVAIGGLTETQDRTNINKVPLLGDIPILGKYLFQHKRTEQVQDETIIFVTVGLANPKSLVEVSGIPSEGQLIHRHLANKAAEAASEGAE